MRRRTPRSKRIQSNIVIVGVDIAKDKNVAVAQIGDNSVLKPLQFSTDEAGFKALLAYAGRAHRMSEGVVFALEPTGHYGAPLVQWLQAREHVVHRVEALHVSRFKELFDGTRRKTDAKDAAVIADLCRQGKYSPWRILKGPFAELRVLSRRRQQLVKHKGQVKNQLHRHVDEVFPELRGQFHSLTCTTALELLSESSAPAEVAAMSLKALEALLRRASRGKLGVARARALQVVARRSVGASDAPVAHRLAIRQAVETLTRVRAQLAEVEEEMRAQLTHVPYAELLLSVPHIGVITVATLLGEMGDFRDFDRAAKLIKMAGLDLVEHSSGKRTGKHRISRRGRSYARQILYLAAIRMGPNVLGRHRRRMVELNKKEPMKAAVANACRLLRVLHAMVRDGVAFDATLHAAPKVAMAA